MGAKHRILRRDDHAVLHFKLGLELVHKQELLAVKVDLANVRRKGIRYQDLNAVLSHYLVVPGVPLAYVGVDRHLSVLGRSIGYADQV